MMRQGPPTPVAVTLAGPSLGDGVSFQEHFEDRCRRVQVLFGERIGVFQRYSFRYLRIGGNMAPRVAMAFSFVGQLQPRRTQSPSSPSLRHELALVWQDKDVMANHGQ